MSDAEVAFILEAIKMVATEGWKLLPQYVLYPEMGEWKHRTNIVSLRKKASFCTENLRNTSLKMTVA